MIVVTAEPAAAAVAERAGATVVHDPVEPASPPPPPAASPRCEPDVERVLLVPGDCPALDARGGRRRCSPARPRTPAW